MPKTKFLFIALILATVVVVSGCGKKPQPPVNNQITNSGQAEQNEQNQQAQENQQQNNQNQQNQQAQQNQIQSEIGPEILETDIDTSDWAEYKSDKYGYSFKLSKEFIFVDEYYGKEIKYNPENDFFVIEKKNSASYENRIGISVTKKDINEYIDEYNKESKQKNGMIKLFEKNNVEFYVKKQNSKYLFPSILYHNSLILEIAGNIQDNYLKAIINSIRFY